MWELRRDQLRSWSLFCVGCIAEYVENCERKIEKRGVMVKEFVGMGEKVLL